jgi:N-acetylmuramoyl-L-alanine amidase
MGYKLFITAGHDKPGSGASYARFDEATEARKLTDDVIAHLIKWYKITPKTDKVDTPLRQVISWLAGEVKSKYDICIEFHFNAGPTSAQGVESFIPEQNTLEERLLAAKLSDTIAQVLGTSKRTGKLGIPGVKVESESQHPRIGILSTPKAATNILVEVCFLTNSREVASYRRNYYLLVQKISDCIGNYITQ